VSPTVLYAKTQLYSFCVGFWLPRNILESAQYFVGFSYHSSVSPFLNIAILVYSVLHSDDFKWGKTTEIVRSVGGKDEDGSRGLALLK
jgi:chitin synthase